MSPTGKLRKSLDILLRELDIDLVGVEEAFCAEQVNYTSVALGLEGRRERNVCRGKGMRQRKRNKRVCAAGVVPRGNGVRN